MNKGGTISLFDGVEVTMVNADHSGSCPGSDCGHLTVGGGAAGFIIASQGIPTIYHAGDSKICRYNLIGIHYQPFQYAGARLITANLSKFHSSIFVSRVHLKCSLINNAL
jgi:L-ascorbate metabolism protein UlaG (beta-lactamase superfamily)